ncbi:MAG: hypothetical protein IT289_05480 [Oligoflexia bacterium]|nr:hypothetical protein [Oligoflexia bacterium]
MISFKSFLFVFGFLIFISTAHADGPQIPNPDFDAIEIIIQKARLSEALDRAMIYLGQDTAKSCQLDATSVINLIILKLQRKSTSVLRVYELTEKKFNPNDLLDFLSLFSTTSAAARDAVEKIRKGELLIKQESEQKIFELTDCRGLACYDPERKIIYMAKGYQFGIQAVALAHELAHLNDRKYLAESKQAYEQLKEVNQSEVCQSESDGFVTVECIKARNRIKDRLDDAAIESELLGYGFEAKFVSELKEKLPCFNAYREHFNKYGLELGPQVTRAQLRANKGRMYTGSLSTPPVR